MKFLKYLLIPLMCILATSKVLLQSHYSKSRAFRAPDSVLYNCIMFTASALFLIPSLFLRSVSVYTWCFGIIAGVLSVGFQLAYMHAFSRGKPVLVTTINNFSMFIPIAASYIFLDESFGVPRVIALALATVSLILITSKDKNTYSKKASSNSWILFTVMAFLCNGLISTNQKVYASKSTGFDVFSFVSITYITASVLLLTTLLIIRRRNLSPIVINKSTLFSAGGAGVFLGAFQCVSTYAASLIDGVILYSVYNVATNVLFAFIRVLFFAERLSKKQIVGVCIAICSVLIMN